MKDSDLQEIKVCIEEENEKLRKETLEGAKLIADSMHEGSKLLAFLLREINSNLYNLHSAVEERM